MKFLTQTRNDNCWQTCVAMLLGCAPEALPDQTHYASSRQLYADALRAFLRKHRELTYVEVEPTQFELVRQDAFHIMIGETVRTTLDYDVWHAVVGFAGEPRWDVHPSRAGLTKVLKWGLITPVPEVWRAEWERRERAGDASVRCPCADCALAEVSRAM